MSLERKMLPNRAEALQEGLRSPGRAETPHATLAFTRGLMAVLRAVVHARRPS
jgi:hypothetical protein